MASVLSWSQKSETATMFVLFMVKYYKVGRQGIGDILKAGMTAITLLCTSMGYNIWQPGIIHCI